MFESGLRYLIICHITYLLTLRLLEIKATVQASSRCCSLVGFSRRSRAVGSNDTWRSCRRINVSQTLDHRPSYALVLISRSPTHDKPIRCNAMLVTYIQPAMRKQSEAPACTGSGVYLTTPSEPPRIIAARMAVQHRSLEHVARRGKRSLDARPNALRMWRSSGCSVWEQIVESQRTCGFKGLRCK